MKKVLFMSILLCGIYADAMNFQDNHRSSPALDELIFFGKIVSSCLICIQDCNNVNPSNTMQSVVSSTADSCSACCCFSPISFQKKKHSLYHNKPNHLDCENNDNSEGLISERFINTPPPVFHSSLNIYQNRTQRSLSD